MIGKINRNLVPMFIGFQESDVEYISETLAMSLEESMEIINLFKEAGIFDFTEEF